MDEKKMKHLEFIQAIITRMAGNLFYLRGWIITLIAGVLVLLSQKSVGYFPYVFLLLIIFIFWGYDAYFLAKERAFRRLYNKVRDLGDENIDFSMSVEEFNEFRDTSMFYCSFSKTLLFFYGPLVLAISYIIFLIK